MTEHWLSKPLEECLEPVRYPAKIPRSKFASGGDYPIVSQEQELINGYWSEESNVLRIDGPVLVFGDHTTIIKYIDFDFVVGADGVKVLKPKPFLNARYLYYFLVAFPVRSLGYSRHYRLLKELKVWFPKTLGEQKRIIAVLDETLTGLDEAIRKTESNLDNVRELCDSHIRTVLGRRGDSWELKQLGHVTENLDRMRVPITKAKRKSGDIPYYGASGVVDYVADYIFNEDLLLVSEDGANLLARSYPIAFSISGKAWVNNHAHVLRFSDLTTQRFTEYYLNSVSLDPYVSGMAQPKLNQRSLNSIPVPMPPPEERAGIVNGFDEVSLKSERLTSKWQRKVELFRELKQSILQKAFAGELTAKAADQAMSVT